MSGINNALENTHTNSGQILNSIFKAGPAITEPSDTLEEDRSLHGPL